MRVISVNVGRAMPNTWDKNLELTGIDKRPVDGPVAVAAPGSELGAVGLAGDRVYDVKNHGGPDQAVYAYAREDYDYWQTELNRDLRNGMFGENLTTTGVDVTNAVIGERWRIGADLVLEVSCPRVPCGTFRGWMNEKGWLKTFTAAQRAGAYLRVVEPGRVEAGDPLVIESRPGHEVTIALTFRAIMNERDLLPSLLAAQALPEELRDTARAYLARANTPR